MWKSPQPWPPPSPPVPPSPPWPLPPRPPTGLPSHGQGRQRRRRRQCCLSPPPPPDICMCMARKRLRASDQTRLKPNKPNRLQDRLLRRLCCSRAAIDHRNEHPRLHRCGRKRHRAMINDRRRRRPLTRQKTLDPCGSYLPLRLVEKPELHNPAAGRLTPVARRARGEAAKRFAAKQPPPTRFSNIYSLTS